MRLLVAAAMAGLALDGIITLAARAGGRVVCPRAEPARVGALVHVL